MSSLALPDNYFKSFEEKFHSQHTNSTIDYLKDYQKYCHKSLSNHRVPKNIQTLFFNPQQQFLDIDSQILDIQTASDRIILNTNLVFLKEEKEESKNLNLIFLNSHNFSIKKIYPKVKSFLLTELHFLQSLLVCHFIWNFDNLGLSIYLTKFLNGVSNYYCIHFNFERMFAQPLNIGHI